MTKKIKCIKYNNSFSIEHQSQINFDAYITLSQDGNTVLITNKRDCEEKKLVLEADKFKVKEMREKHYKNQKRENAKLKFKE